jgi:hypothetical protein
MIRITTLVLVISIGFLVPKAAAQSHKYSKMARVKSLASILISWAATLAWIRATRWCGRRDLNPHGPFKPCGFSYRLRLSPPERDTFRKVTPGLRSGLSLHHPPVALELRCCPSSLYTFPAGVSTGLGSGLPFKVSPNLSSSASPVSQTSTQVFLKSAAYAIPPRPRAAVLP